MAKHYGWTGQLRHGLWKCARCNHWNYYRTHSIRIDSRCYAQGCDYRARVVLDREDRKGGRPRQVVVKEYPSYRPPSTVKQEQRARNIWQRRNHEQATRMGLKLDLGVFHKASEIQAAIDEADLDRHGRIFRLVAHPEWKRHPFLGQSRLDAVEGYVAENEPDSVNSPTDKPENDPQV